MKKEFSRFYSNKSEDLIYKEWSWKCKKFVLNDLEEEETEIVIKKIEEYESNYTKINIIKGTNNFKSLNNKLAYVKLSPLYNR